MSASDHISPQFRTYWHATNERGSKGILEKGLSSGTYLTTAYDVAEDYGDHIFKVKVPTTHNFASSERQYESQHPKFHGYKGDPEKSEVIIHDTKGVVLEGPHMRDEDWG